MKKIIAIALTLVFLCGAIPVLADTEIITPSKTTGDLTTLEVTVENPIEGKPVTAVPVNSQNAAQYKAQADAAEAEIAKAFAAGTVEKYFGEETTNAIKGVLGDAEKINMDEFFAFVLNGYEEAMGKATFTAKMPTPYAGKEVAVLIGLVEDGQVNWTTIKGIGQEDGSVQFTVEPELAQKIQQGVALMTVCSK